MTDAVSQRYGSADPDPDPDPDLYQNVTDPEHCSSLVPSKTFGGFIKDEYYS
jgi:hypothetical protein